VAAIGVYSYATFWLLILVRPPHTAPRLLSLVRVVHERWWFR
jgi:hypothetical protein